MDDDREAVALRAQACAPDLDDVGTGPDVPLHGLEEEVAPVAHGSRHHLPGVVVEQDTAGAR
jgi:hypothetical protein